VQPIEIKGILICDCTFLSPGGDICKHSFDSAYVGIFPLMCETFLPSVDLSPPWRSDHIRCVSVWYSAEPLWASPSDCRLHTRAKRTGWGNQIQCSCRRMMQWPANCWRLWFKEIFPYHLRGRKHILLPIRNSVNVKCFLRHFAVCGHKIQLRLIQSNSNIY